MAGHQLKTGVDIIEISRIEEIIERRGERFLKKIFTEEEIRFSNNKIERRNEVFEITFQMDCVGSTYAP